jgi:REP element-mobilizing transposase RayT
MPRALRPHAPGNGVHITARLQGGAKLFSASLRDEVASTICEAAAMAGADVLAFVVMPNHFHLVIQQGPFPLGWMMQRAMQQVAMLMKRSHRIEGHVFGRRYWSGFCPDPRYLREAIVYTHLNPWKAALCAEPEDYRWSTAAEFAQKPDAPGWCSALQIAKARLLFAFDTYDIDDVLRNYAAYVDYCKRRYLSGVPGARFTFSSADPLHRPSAPLGDEYWLAHYPQLPVTRITTAYDIAERASQILKSLDADCTLDTLRLTGNSRKARPIRDQLIAILRARGYRGRDISRCLFVSPSVVSRVNRAIGSALAANELHSGFGQSATEKAGT